MYTGLCVYWCVGTYALYEVGGRLTPVRPVKGDSVDVPSGFRKELLAEGHWGGGGGLALEFSQIS